VRPKFWPISTSVCERGGDESVSRLVNLIVHSIVNYKALCLFAFGDTFLLFLMHAHIFAQPAQSETVRIVASVSLYANFSSALSKLFELPTLLPFGLGDAPN
jgi:hypothetical protein